MDMSNMKNMIILKNLPSNLVDEAIVVLKENKKVHKYQIGNLKEGHSVKSENSNFNKEYIIKEAEMLIKSYTDNWEKQTPKWKNNMKRLEKRYKISVKLNFLLFFTTIFAAIVSVIV